MRTTNDSQISLYWMLSITQPGKRASPTQACWLRDWMDRIGQCVGVVCVSCRHDLASMPVRICPIVQRKRSHSRGCGCPDMITQQKDQNASQLLSAIFCQSKLPAIRE